MAESAPLSRGQDLAALDILKDFQVIIVTHVTGLKEPDVQEFPEEMRRTCESRGAKVITVPVANYDDNQHAENENMRVDYLWEGMETFAALMTMP